MQETYTTAKIEKLYKYQWHGNMIFSHNTSNSRGVIVAFRYGLEYKTLSDTICNPNGSYIILNMEIQGSPYILVNCYAPNNEQEQIKLFQVIRDHLKKPEPDKDVNIILGGDRNLIFNLSLDAFGGKPVLKSNSLRQLYDLMSEFDLTDVWRIRNPTLRQFSWRRRRAEMTMTFGFFLDFGHTATRGSKFLSPLQSDHSPVLLKLRSADSAERGGVTTGSSVIHY